MRSPIPTLAVALALTALVVPVAAADDEPAFGAEDVALEAEHLPEGWETTWDEVPGTPGEALVTWALETAAAAGAAPDDILTEVRILRTDDGQAATLAWLELETKGEAVEQALEQAGTPRGYEVRRLGDPRRLLVVAAPEALRSRLVAMARTYAVTTLTRLAFERLESGSRVGARSHAEAAASIDEAAGSPHAVLGLAAAGEGDAEAAIAAFERAFDPRVALPPEGRLALRAYATWGGLMLTNTTVADDADAKEALAAAVALEEVAEPADRVFTHRYNLACAHARLGETDAAFTQLRKSLEQADDAMGDAEFRGFVKHAMQDPDLESLRSDPRWEALIQKVTGHGGDGGAHGGM